MATSVKYQALKTFGDFLETQIASMAGRVSVIQSDFEDELPFPSLAILPGFATYEPYMGTDQIVYAPEDASYAVFDMGTFRGSAEIRALSPSAYQREQIEESVFAALCSQEGRGVVTVSLPTVTVGSQATLYQPRVTFLLDDSVWEEEQVFDKIRYSFIKLKYEFPLLVLRTGVYTIDEMVVATTEDLTSTLESDIQREELSINEGNIDDF